MVDAKNYSKLILLMFLILFSAFGCKSKKKAMEAKNAAEKARMEQESADKRRKEEILKQEQAAAAEKVRQEAEAKRQLEAKISSAPKTRLSRYFESIANASNVTSANATINEALSMFASPETPVLIAISESNGQKDYDKPTTIKAYLNYLKDQKKNINTLTDLSVDSTGKITSLELTKN